MKLYQLLSLFVLSTALYSCRQEPEKILPGMWDVTQLKYPDLNRLMSVIPGGGSDAANTAMTSQFFRGNFFKLNEDKTFTCISGSGHFLYGIWKFHPGDSTIRLLQPGRSRDSIVLRMKEWSSSKMVVARSEPGFNIELTLVKDHARPLHEKDDYSTVENNKWRFQSPVEETDEQIRQRVIGSLRFAVMYLSRELDRDEESVSLKPIVLPVIIAGNGIGMERETEIEHDWKALFYSDEDAMKGYQLLKNAFNKKIDIPQNKQRLELDIDLLKQLLQNIQ